MTIPNNRDNPTSRHLKQAAKAGQRYAPIDDTDVIVREPECTRPCQSWSIRRLELGGYCPCSPAYRAHNDTLAGVA